ncbi:MAG: indolepyruvate ferredoxin oxidoreductase family protein, partial [Paracoccaceae bacterium]|nr:indolepyruvate ferredoxin oxidoreductase family protein [Paracoccaceae bacterium]
AASSMFTGRGHVFQNLGEGTWYHSGSMAIRQAVAAKANITYKILYNDAVAMTGGQPVDGPISVQEIARVCRAEGVQRIALVSDMPEKFDPAAFPAGATIHHRRDMDAVQRELRGVKGVSVLIYEQTCATEKRRRRKRGTMADPQKFVVINELVCEGCGDCSVESNCLSVEPVETEFGIKRRINQSTCNKDYSCVNGFCPSFVTVEGVGRRKPEPQASPRIEAALQSLPEPVLVPLTRPYDLLVTGVGGTGVVTVGALIAMAAHVEGRGASVLDYTGFAQKFGPVISYIRLAPAPEDIHQVRIDQGAADALIGCDVVVSSSPKASAAYRQGTRAVVNLAEMPTGDIVLHRDASLQVDARIAAIGGAVGRENLAAVNANVLAGKLLGDSVYANILMLGFAWQRGLVPVSLAALDRAIVLNGVAPDVNRRAFALGRLACVDAGLLQDALGGAPKAAPSVEALIASRAEFLTRYQNAAYAKRYTRALAAMPTELQATAARALFRLMAYKDEYEVARLHRDPAFMARIAAEFEAGARLKYHLAPPFLPARRDARGRPRKRQFGVLARILFGPLARLKVVRGTILDPFGYTAERRMERDLIAWYEGLLARCAADGAQADMDLWQAILAAPLDIRGYGPVKAAAAEKARAKVDALLQPDAGSSKAGA